MSFKLSFYFGNFSILGTRTERELFQKWGYFGRFAILFILTIRQVKIDTRFLLFAQLPFGSLFMNGVGFDQLRSHIIIIALLATKVRLLQGLLTGNVDKHPRHDRTLIRRDIRRLKILSTFFMKLMTKCGQIATLGIGMTVYLMVEQFVLLWHHQILPILPHLFLHVPQQVRLQLLLPGKLHLILRLLDKPRLVVTFLLRRVHSLNDLLNVRLVEGLGHVIVHPNDLRVYLIVLVLKQSSQLLNVRLFYWILQYLPDFLLLQYQIRQLSLHLPVLCLVFGRVPIYLLLWFLSVLKYLLPQRVHLKHFRRFQHKKTLVQIYQLFLKLSVGILPRQTALAFLLFLVKCHISKLQCRRTALMRPSPLIWRLGISHFYLLIRQLVSIKELVIIKTILCAIFLLTA